MTPLLMDLHTQKLHRLNLTEEQTKEQGHEVKTGQFSPSHMAALAAGEAQRLHQSGRRCQNGSFIGMYVVSAGAGDIVHQGAIAMEFIIKY